MEIKEWLKTPNEEIEPENLRLAIQRLSIEDFPTRTAFIKAKDSLQQKYNEVIRHRANIQTKNDEQEEKISPEKTKQLFMENLSIIQVASEYGNIPIDNDLNIILTFYPCKHTKKMKIYDTMLVENNKYRNQVLYTKWYSFFREGGVISGRFNCTQCREEKDSMRAKFFRYDDKPIGSTTLKIRLLR
jgi:hypothetical protein